MFAIKRPTKTVDIVTDLDTLAQAVDLKQQIDDATPNTAGMTDAEICAAKKATDKLRRELKTKLKTIDESTVTLTLRGLGSSQWNQIVLATTTVDQKTRASGTRSCSPPQQWTRKPANRNATSTGCSRKHCPK